MKTSPARSQRLLAGLLLAVTLAAAGWAVASQSQTHDHFMPHAHCYLLKRELILLHGISDFLIGAAYVAISATLSYLVLRARREIPFHWMMLAFAAFIVACGATHFMEVWTLQRPDPPYWAAGNLKLVTAIASLLTAVLLPPLTPKILRLLEAARLSAQRKAELEKTNASLSEAHERVKQLDQLKTNFFANVSHELRTPLTLILGPLDRLLASGALDAGEQRELETARRNALLLHKHVNDLLDVSKLEAGRMQLRYARVDLAALARMVGNIFASSHLQHLGITVTGPEHLWVEADADKLHRVLMNLLSNAFKFTPEGGAVTVSLREQGAEAILMVEDTGPGVALEAREAIFERFHQGRAPTSRGGSGTGLGLSIVKEFVELHGGSVYVGDAPHGGASFCVRLPLRAPEGTPLAEPAPLEINTAYFYPGLLAGIDGAELPRSGDAAPDDAKPLVLVVEDNAEMRTHIARTLEPDYRVVTAANGRIALALLEREVPDLILTDLMMPEMAGGDLLAAVRRERKWSGVPIIVLTARADDELKFNLLLGGAQDYLVKPFAIQELRARVQNQIGTKRVRDTLQGELNSQEQDITRLAREVTLRVQELERAKNEAEAANRTKDQFLAMLSHELRTPLTPALATAIHLSEQQPGAPDEIRDGLRVIRRNIELEARLIDDLLDLNRIARGKLELRLADVDAHEMIRNAAEMCQAELRKKGVRLALELRAAHHHVRGDAARLLQIVWNLLLNAVHFTPADGLVTVRTGDAASGRLAIEVADTGAGIAPELLPKIFEPFQQGDLIRRRTLGGLGLGLAVARGLVDAHGGAISAASPGLGHGATFRVELDVVSAPEPGETGPLAPRTAPARSLHILLVEDNADTLAAMERLLRHWGYRVETASTVSAALEKTGAAEFDVLVSDLGLPDGHGTDIMAALRRRGARTIGVGISGYGMEEDIRRSREAGFSEHLVKPVATEQLKRVLRELAATAPA